MKGHEHQLEPGGHCGAFQIKAPWLPFKAP
jgi:hypothetical protein